MGPAQDGEDFRTGFLARRTRRKLWNRFSVVIVTPTMSGRSARILRTMSDQLSPKMSAGTISTGIPSRSRTAPIERRPSGGMDDPFDQRSAKYPPGGT